jgi:hypothetical protein
MTSREQTSQALNFAPALFHSSRVDFLLQ